jgi:hypothetical protein
MRGSFFVLAMLVAGTAWAEAPEANPGRPSFSDNASTTAHGAFEVETGAAADPDAEGHASTFKYGVTDTFDVRFTAGGPADPAGDIDALNLMLKWTLADPEDGAGFALAPYVNLPAPDGDDREGYGAVFILTALAGPFQIDANALVDAAPSATGDGQDWSVSPIGTLGFGLIGDLGGFAEIASTIPTSGEPRVATTMCGAGLGYALRPNLVFDASLHLRTGGEDAPDWIAQAGLTFAVWVGPH